MSNVKEIIFKSKIEDAITELYPKTNWDMVRVDDGPLSQKITNIIADIATKASINDLTSGLNSKADKTHSHAQSEVTGLTEALSKLASNDSVTAAIEALRQEMLGDTPVEAYNTFTELAAYIASHQEVSDALTAAIGQKADKATTISGYGITDAYTKTETDKKISDAISSATGGESAASVKASLEAYKTENDARIDALEEDTHTHINKSVLDTITSNNITTWNAKSDSIIYYSETEPTSLKEGDLWVELINTPS